MSDKQYLTCAETAKLLRAELARQFPGAKFWVQSDTYSMGASIDVYWIDGPAEIKVESILKRFEGADWLSPDGTIILAEAEGTEMCRGIYPRIEREPPCQEAKRVHLGTDYIFANRNYTRPVLEQIQAQMVKAGYPALEIEDSNTYIGRSKVVPTAEYHRDWSTDDTWLAYYKVLAETDFGETQRPETEKSKVKPETTKADAVTYGEYKGHPTITLPLNNGDNRGFTFGLNKAKAIVAYFDEIKVFAEQGA